MAGNPVIERTVIRVTTCINNDYSNYSKEHNPTQYRTFSENKIISIII